MAKDIQKDKKPKGDDRNLVTAESEGAGFDFEDRLYLFWKNYGSYVIIAVVAVIAVFLGRWVIAEIHARHVASLQSAYREAKTDTQKRAFAEGHRGTALAGVTFLQLADEEYSNGDFPKAVADYGSAAAMVGQPVLVNRAKIGQALSMIQAGQHSKGKALLKEVADDNNVSDALRCEAHFHLATMAIADGVPELARSELDAITTLAPTSFWASRAMGLKATLPAPAEKTDKVAPAAATSK